MAKRKIDEPSTFSKKKSNKGSSKIIELLDPPDTTSGDPAVDEPANTTENDDTPVTGRQHGAKNYTLEELTLLNKCMAAAVPIGPEGVTAALELYGRVAEEKGWAKRNAKALRKKWDKLPTIRPRSGDDEMQAIILEADRIEKNLQVESGMIVVQDPRNPLHWEQAYFALTTEDDDITTPPPSPPPPSSRPPNPPPTKPAGGLGRNKMGSIIDLTLSDNESPLTRVARAKVECAKTSRAKAEIVVKQEIIDDDVVVKVAGKGKEVKPVKDFGIGVGNLKVAAKTYRHGEGNVAAKTTKAETILASIADGLSPEAQEKRKISCMNLLRETMHQEHKDRVANERVQELKLEIQALKKEIAELRRDNEFYRSQATEALTALSLLTSTSHSFTPIHAYGHPAPYTPTTPAFTTDPSLYSVPATDDQSVEPDGIAGPGPQTMRYRQQVAEFDDSKILEDE